VANESPYCIKTKPKTYLHPLATRRTYWCLTVSTFFSFSSETEHGGGACVSGHFHLHLHRQQNPLFLRFSLQKAILFFFGPAPLSPAQSLPLRQKEPLQHRPLLPLHPQFRRHLPELGLEPMVPLFLRHRTGRELSLCP